MVIDLFGIVLISLLLLVIAGAAYGFWWLMETRDKQQKRKSSPSRRRTKPDTLPSRVPIDLKPRSRNLSRSSDNSPNQIPRPLREKLLKMVGNDAKVERRLIDNLQKKHPDKDLVWCYEKAIVDLERDRRI